MLVLLLEILSSCGLGVLLRASASLYEYDVLL